MDTGEKWLSTRSTAEGYCERIQSCRCQLPEHSQHKATDMTVTVTEFQLVRASADPGRIPVESVGEEIQTPLGDLVLRNTQLLERAVQAQRVKEPGQAIVADLR